MPKWLIGLIEAVLGALFAPRNSAATSEAERAGAAEAQVRANDAIIVKVGQADSARNRAGVAQPVGGGLPDDGFRRD